MALAAAEFEPIKVEFDAIDCVEFPPVNLQRRCRLGPRRSADHGLSG